MAVLRLKLLREAAGLHLSTAAYLCGCPTPRLSEYERGRRRPSAPRLNRMAAVLKFEGEPRQLLDAIEDDAPAGVEAR